MIVLLNLSKFFCNPLIRNFLQQYSEAWGFSWIHSFIVTLFQQSHEPMKHPALRLGEDTQ